MCAFHGAVNCAELLINKYGIRANTRAFDGTTALHLAARQGHKVMIYTLLDAKANPNAITARDPGWQSNLVGAPGFSPLHIAALFNQAEAARLLMNEHADARLVSGPCDLLPNCDYLHEVGEHYGESKVRVAAVHIAAAQEDDVSVLRTIVQEDPGALTARTLPDEFEHEKRGVPERLQHTLENTLQQMLSRWGEQQSNYFATPAHFLKCEGAAGVLATQPYLCYRNLAGQTPFETMEEGLARELMRQLAAHVCKPIFLVCKNKDMPQEMATHTAHLAMRSHLREQVLASVEYECTGAMLLALCIQDDMVKAGDVSAETLLEIASCVSFDKLYAVNAPPHTRSKHDAGDAGDGDNDAAGDGDDESGESSDDAQAKMDEGEDEVKEKQVESKEKQENAGDEKKGSENDDDDDDDDDAERRDKFARELFEQQKRFFEDRLKSVGPNARALVEAVRKRQRDSVAATVDKLVALLPFKDHIA